MKAIHRSIRITSKKINLIADLVRNKPVTQALDILKFTPKKGAKILYKIVRSAMSNAENNFKQEAPTLFVKEIVVTEGTTLKRGVPVSRGRIYPILKRTAHVSVFLGVNADAEVAGKTKKTKSSSKKEEGTKKAESVETEEKVEKKATSTTKKATKSSSAKTTVKAKKKTTTKKSS